MAHLSLSQGFLVPVPKLAVSLQPASPLSPPFSPPPQHLASLQPNVILALTSSEAAGLLRHCCHGRITWNLRPIIELNPLVELVHRKILACIPV
jgi:hypothetical protein